MPETDIPSSHTYSFWPQEIAFLEEYCLDATTLSRISHLARIWRVPPEQAAIKSGLISSQSYYRALAAYLGLDFIMLSHHQINWAPLNHLKGSDIARANSAPLIESPSGRYIATAPEGRHLRKLLHLRNHGTTMSQFHGRIQITTPDLITNALRTVARHDLEARARHSLYQKNPFFSALPGATSAQIYFISTLLFSGIMWLTITPLLFLDIFIYLCSFLFLGHTVLHTTTLLRPVTGGGRSSYNALRSLPPPDELPVYTILIPLFQETAIVPRLITAMERLDYPLAKLDIKIILEEEDEETIAAIRATALPAYYDIIIVPRSWPRTKPKALDYALQFAHGHFVTIFDAEDRPEPDQLLRAVAAFKAAPPDIACLQARLAFYNSDENWLTRQFAIEYNTLFGDTLPALAHLGLPLPLGGTSNHFRLGALEEIGGWDPYNMTEDIDIGMRLARYGYRSDTLSSVTYEEATNRLKPWFNQRTRWLKGWIQTMIVHSRQPVIAAKQFGKKGFIIFILLTGGALTSILTYPLFIVLLIYGVVSDQFLSHPDSFMEITMIGMGLINLLIGYGTLIGIAIRGLYRRNLSRLLPHLIWMPFYWILISLAAYRAIIHYVLRPFQWAKTEHHLLPYRIFRKRH